MKFKVQQFKLIVLLVVFVYTPFMIIAPEIADAGPNHYVSVEDGAWAGSENYYLNGEVTTAWEAFEFYAVRHETYQTYLLGGTEFVDIECPVNGNCQWNADVDLSGLMSGNYFLLVRVRFPGNIFREDTFPKESDPSDPKPDCEGVSICITG